MKHAINLAFCTLLIMSATASGAESTPRDFDKEIKTAKSWRTLHSIGLGITSSISVWSSYNLYNNPNLQNGLLFAASGLLWVKNLAKQRIATCTLHYIQTEDIANGIERVTKLAEQPKYTLKPDDKNLFQEKKADCERLLPKINAEKTSWQQINRATNVAFGLGILGGVACYWKANETELRWLGSHKVIEDLKKLNPVNAFKNSKNI